MILVRFLRFYPKFNSFRQFSTIKQTALYDYHVSKGGKMVPFAGWSMPVVYDGLSIVESTLHTRRKASLFDVSHMLQVEVAGKDAGAFLELISVADVGNLRDNTSCLSVFTNQSGGIIDDCIITRTSDSSFYIVANASRAETDIANIQEHLKSFKHGSSDVKVTPLPDQSLIALQGPSSASVLQRGVGHDLSSLKFMNSVPMTILGIKDCRVSRCGYTGEDGFEISVPSCQVLALTEKLVSSDDVQLAGLGARDICRLEAGLCLYGNDISEETTPIEAGLAWCISKRRRAEGGFVGADIILKQLKNKPEKKRVGLINNEGGPPVRSGYSVLDKDGNKIGAVTSGSPSPHLKASVAMAYVPSQYSKLGHQLQVQIRKSKVNCTVTKMPFVPSNYYNK